MSQKPFQSETLSPTMLQFPPHPHTTSPTTTPKGHNHGQALAEMPTSSHDQLHALLGTGQHPGRCLHRHRGHDGHPQGIHHHRWHLVEVGRSPIRKDTGEVIHTGDVGRYAQADTGEWVLLNDRRDCAIAPVPRAWVRLSRSSRSRTSATTWPRTRSRCAPRHPRARSIRPLTVRSHCSPPRSKSRKVVALVKVALRGPARYGLLDARWHVHR